MTPTILITGGAGFVGSCLVRQLVGERAAHVVNLDKLTYAGNLDSLTPVSDDPLHTFVRGDIGDRALVSSLLEEHRPRAIVHLAAESHVDRSIDAPADFINTNVVGTFQLLEAARDYWAELSVDERQAFRFLQVSTDEVYGSLAAGEAREEASPYRPNSPYSASKAAADHLVRAYDRTYHLPTVTVISSNIYGPYQFPEKLIPLMIFNARQGQPLPVYGDGQQIRDWLFVEDHCRAVRAVLNAGLPGEVYHVAGHAPRTNLQVVQTICQLIDRLCPGLRHGPCAEQITFVPDRPGHDRRYAIDTSKIELQLGWRPQESFESGLARTVQWYLENPGWMQRVTDGVYRGERLGLQRESQQR